MRTQLLLLLLLLTLFTSVALAGCAATLGADSVPANPGIDAATLSAAVGGRALVNTKCSEVVNVLTQAAYNEGDAWPRVNCPHLRTDLVPIESVCTLTAGSTCTIGAGVRVLLRACSIDAPTSVVTRIHVQAGGTLVFNDESWTLHIRELRVDQDGEVFAGLDTCPLFGSIGVQFYGTRADSHLNNFNADLSRTAKGLLSRGRVDIFGKRYKPTWTRLARSARAGDSVIFVADKHNWEVGQEILVVTSAWFDCPDQYKDQWCKPCQDWQGCAGQPHENERRTIVAMSSDCASGEYAIQLSAPLNFLHYAGTEYQTEVALLTRRIHFWGQDTGDNFGGHTIVTNSSRFSGVQAGPNMGQAEVMARYPFHFHLGQSLTSSYLEDCVVVDSNFRAYTVHGTHDLQLRRNIAYNVKGFAYYLEDAVEVRNRFEHNFGAHVHPIVQPANGGGGQEGEIFQKSPQLLLPADASASVFYISNPFNDFVGNAASGGWSGFAFPNIPKPIGLHAGTANRDPMSWPTKSFVGNTAHSSGFYWRAHGSCIYTGAWLESTVANPTPTTEVLQYSSGRHERNTKSEADINVRDWMRFEDTKVWGCFKGIAHWGDGVVATRNEFHDIVTSAMLFGKAALVDSLVNVRSGNARISTEQAASRWNKVEGFQFYDTWVQIILSSITFRGFKEARGDSMIRYMDHSDQFLPQGINTMAGVRMEDSDPSTILVIDRCGPQCAANPASWTMSSRMEAIWDFDGSIAGTGRPTIFGSNINWWLADDANCRLDARFRVPLYSCDWTTNRHVAYIAPKIPGLMEGCDTSIGTSPCNGQNAAYTVGRMRQWGDRDFGIKMSPWPGVTGVADMGWHWRPQCSNISIDGAPSSFMLEGRVQIQRGHFVVLSVRYPAQAQFQVRLVGEWSGNSIWDMPMTASRAAVLNPVETVVAPSAVTCGLSRGNFPSWSTMCNLGGQGPSWHFDGEFLFLRIVPVACYFSNTRAMCESSTWTQGGVQAFDQIGAFRWEVTVTCPGCAVQGSRGGVNFFNVPDTVPPSSYLVPQPGTLRASSNTPAATKRSCPSTTVNQVCAAVSSTPSTAASSTAAPSTAAPSTAAPSTAAQSTAAQSTAAQSTAAQSTSGQSTSVQSTAVTAAQSTGAPTTASQSTAAGSAATTQMGAPTAPPTPTMSVPCSFVVYVPAITRRSFRVRFRVELPNLDCPDHVARLCRELGVVLGDMQVHNIWAGSSWFEVSVPSSDAVFFQRLARGTLQNFRAGEVLEGVDQNGNRVTSPAADETPVWIIAVAVVAGVLLVGLIVVVIILVMRRRNRQARTYSSLRSDDSDRFEPMHMAPVYGGSSSVPVVATAPSNVQMLTCTVTHSVPVATETALAVTQGNIAFVEPADWAEGGEWVWCLVGNNRGYVPRSHLRRN